MVILLAISYTACGQAYQQGLEKLPVGVKATFSKKYPATSEENWAVIDQSVLVSFKSGVDYFDAFFDENGKWLRTEKAILFDQLPKVLQDSLKTGEFSTWEKGSVFDVALPGDSGIYKIFVYSKDWNEMELNFDKTGKRIL